MQNPRTRGFWVRAKEDQPRQVPGRYLMGVPEQVQVSAPADAVLMVGVSVTVTAWPTALELPITVTTPLASMVAVWTLPTGAIEQSAGTELGIDDPPAD